MLYLLDTPRWSDGAGEIGLPDTLPGWTIAFLALQRDWVARERLCTLLWPDAAPAETQHNLRVNLYRMRSLLAQWGVATALQAERRRVRLNLPTDVSTLGQALASADGGADLLRHRRPLLAGMSLPGFPALEAWAELERSAIHASWREAALAKLATKALPTAEALELGALLLQADPLDEQALAHQLHLLAEQGRVADARHLFQQFSARRRDELDAEPPPALAAWVARLSDAGAAPHPASARGGFIGRAVELVQLEAMLANGRLLTLRGPGGVGKSRLARELMQRIGTRWRDAAIWVPLSDIASAEGALARLADRLGLVLAPQREVLPQLAAALADRASLIVFDNAEHLDDFAALMSRLLPAAPASAWLVTSRGVLAIAGERTYELEGLPGPDGDDAAIGCAEAIDCDAMRLFGARVRAVDADFDIARHWRPCLDIVRLGGGWPLAIELAAAAVADRGAAEVAADLRQSFDALASGRAPAQARHASVRASLQLSWQQLQADEQAALARLSVLRGSFARAAAAAVSAMPSAVLARLRERSLLQWAGGGRHALHPLVAQFAAERLAADPRDRDAAERRHAEHFASRLQAAASGAPDRATALIDEIAIDFEDMRQAWSTLVRAGDGARLAAVAPAWSEFGTARGRIRELIDLVAAAIAAVADDAAARNALLAAAANLHYRGGEFDTACALAHEALAAAAAAGDGRTERAMLGTLALAMKSLGRYDEAEGHAAQGLRLARASGAERDIASHANTCAMLAKMRGDQAAAAALYAQAIAIHRRLANHRGLVICLNNLGNVYRALDDPAAAQRHFEECLRIAEQHGIASTRAFALVNLALVHEKRGDGALAQSFARRARAEPAAEPAVLTAADTVIATTATDGGDFAYAHEALCALARRARRTGLHAAMLDTVHAHARLLAATGRRDAALARWAFLLGHPQLPGMQRGDIEQAIDALVPAADERTRAQEAARGLALDILLESVFEPIDAAAH